MSSIGEVCILEFVEQFEQTRIVNIMKCACRSAAVTETHTVDVTERQSGVPTIHFGNLCKRTRNIVELLCHSSEDIETVPIQSAHYSAAVITGL